MPPHFVWAGQGTGVFTHEVGIPEIGQVYDLLGSATLTGLGRVNVSGAVQSVGFILHGHAWGKLLLTNAKGSVTLRLEGPEQNGFAALPHQFTFDVVGGSGSYKHLNGHGTLQLVIAPATQAHGTFTLAVGLVAQPLG
jgi:hypothetical protein